MVKNMKNAKDYGLNELYLFEYPYTTINGEGRHIGKPAVFVRFQGCTVGCVWCDAMGTWPTKKGQKYAGIKITNKDLTSYIDTECPRTPRIWITGGEPTEHSYECWSFIKYMKKYGEKERIFHMITAGKKFDVKLLYELDQITIDIKPPSSKADTPNEFISWCMEDRQLREKVEFKMVVAATAEDITFARNTIFRLQHFHRDITIQPLYWSEAEVRKEENIGQQVKDLSGYLDNFTKPIGWESYAQFAEEFMDSERYENVRVLPQLHKIYWPGRISGI